MEPAQLGLLFFIAMEIMFFAGLISAFLVFRLGPVEWPPAGQPRLPAAVTGFNTLILLLSGFCLYQGSKALRSGEYLIFLKWLEATVWSGFLFLVIQGSEWIRMAHFGVTLFSGVYGGFFYLLVGLHGFHALGGFLALYWVRQRAYRPAYVGGDTLGVDLCRMYWYFVVGLWPILYFLIYW